jgi:D-ribose pyranose/furanose isomerase RbsD
MCVVTEISHSHQTLQSDSNAVQPVTSHYADVSRAWGIMDIMNNIEVIFENTVLRIIFESEMKEEEEDLRKLQNEKFHNLYSL